MRIPEELARDTIELAENIGSGYFGSVHRAMHTPGDANNTLPYEVAVKSVRKPLKHMRTRTRTLTRTHTPRVVFQEADFRQPHCGFEGGAGVSCAPGSSTATYWPSYLSNVVCNLANPL